MRARFAFSEAVDMTIWLAERVDWLSRVRGEWRRRLPNWRGDVLYECSTLVRSKSRLSRCGLWDFGGCREDDAGLKRLYFRISWRRGGTHEPGGSQGPRDSGTETGGAGKFNVLMFDRGQAKGQDKRGWMSEHVY